MIFTYTDKGVCAAKGFRAAGIHCGVRKNKTKKDLCLIVSDVKCSAAALYTSNLVKGAPITVTKQNLSDGKAQAIIVNSGNANTCNSDGIEVARQMCTLVEKYTGIPASDVVVASTGVIGQKLSIEPIRNGMRTLVDGLGYNNSDDANEAIMTTDLKKKSVAVTFTLDGKECHIGGIAKGSGMIHPNLATMLVFITTDAAISSEMLEKALREDVKDTFNMTSIDGDTTTNDTLCVLANGLAGNREIIVEGGDFEIFKQALRAITEKMCRMIAADGEGATRMMEVRVSGAADEDSARKIAKSIACSSLVKTAVFGADANWGRVLCALGYSGAQVDVGAVGVDFISEKGEIAVCRDGSGVEFSEEKAKEILLEDSIIINVTLKDGNAGAKAFGCDLTYDYVKINGDYRT